MKFNKIVQVPATIIFDKIIESGLYDIKQATGKTLDISDLPGFTYEKKISNQTVKLLFNQVTSPSVYEFTTTTVARTHHTRWELVTLSENETSITITETQGTSNLFQLFIDKMMEILLTRAKKNQMSVMIDRMEKQYQKVL